MKHALTQIFALGLLINTGQAQTTLYSNNFSNGSSGWNLGGVQQTNFDLWVVNSIYFCSSTTPNQGDGRYLHVGNDLFGDYCAYSLFAGFGSSGSVSASMTSGINTVGSSSVELSFDWLCAGQVGVLESYGFLQYSTNGGGSWTDITQPRQKYNGQSTWTSITITSSHVPGFLNQNNLRFRFGWQNSGYGANPTFSIDNMVVTGSSGPVCTNVGGASSSNPTPICTDQTSTLSVSGQAGNIQWQSSTTASGAWSNVSGGSGATTASYSTGSLSSTTYFRAKLSQAGCPDEYSSVSSVLVIANEQVAITIAANPSTAICVGDNVSFTATPTNGGNSPAYQWKVNGSNVGTNSPNYSSSSLSNNNQVTCVLQSNLTCTSGNPATSNMLTITVNPTQTSSVTISVNPATAVCQGTALTFTASPVNPGNSPSYQWRVNGVDFGSNSATYTTSNLNNGDGVTCELSSSANCLAQNQVNSNTINPTINSNVSVSVGVIASPSNEVCVGTMVSFNATPTAGGANPSYQWQVNGGNVGANNALYTSSSLTDQDVVTCVVTSNANCTTNNPATSVPITMTINAAAFVEISSSNLNGICGGATSTLSINGSWSSYLWSTADPSSEIVVSTAGFYSVTATDQNGCSGSDDIEILEGLGEVDGLFTDWLYPSFDRLNWTINPAAHHYAIRGNELGQAGYFEVSLPPGHAGVYTVYDLNEGTSYFWQVIAFCDTSETSASAWSEPDTFTTRCSAPLPISTDQITDISAVLNWTDLPGVDGYQIRGRAVGGTWKQLLINDPQVTSHLVEQLTPSTSYEWKIRTICDTQRNSHYTPFQNFTTNASKLSATGTDKPGMSISQDGSQILVNVHFDFPQQISWEIFDLKGSLVQEFNEVSDLNKVVNIDLSSLNAGLYILKCTNGSSIVTQPVIVFN